MIRNLILAILSLTLLVGAFGTAAAQGGNGSGGYQNQARNEMDRTDELLVQARDAVRSSNSAIAAQALERAEAFQSAARQAYAGEGYVMALSLTRKSREQASLAISNSRLSEQLEGVVQGRLERAREMLDQARETLPTPLGPVAETVLEQGRNNLAQAWQFYRQRSFKAAVKMVEQTEQAARRLAAIGRLSHQAGETFQYRLENAERLMEYAHELLADCGSEVGQEHLRQAHESYETARELQAKGQSQAALLALGRAKDAARRAARQCQDGDRLQERYRRLSQELEQAREQLTELSGRDAETARGLLEQAREQLQLAYRHLSENQTESAQLSLQAAQLTLRQAQKYIGGN